MSKNRRSRDRADESGAYNDSPRERPPRRLKRWRRRFVVLLLLLVAVVAAAPTIIGRTGVRNSLLSQAMPAGWTINSEQASLGWATSQAIAGLTIADRDGNLLLTVESVTVPRSLVSLVADPSDLGQISLVRPTAYLETRADGSNWEDFVAALEAMQQESSGEAISLAVQVVEGVVRGTDAMTGKQWLVDNANVNATIAQSIVASGSAEVATADSPERGKLKFNWQPNNTGSQQLEVLAERVPLTPLEPWLARSSPGTQVAGVVSTDARLSWQIDPQRGMLLQSAGRLEASNLEVSAAALVGDRLRSRTVIAPWEISVIGDEVIVKQLGVDADWAKVTATGSLSRQELQTISFDQLLTGQLPKRATRLAGEVNLATLAAMLPRTLQLREGVRIDSGNLKFDVAGGQSGERFVWQADASVANVAGTDGRRQVRWEQPIEASATLGNATAGRPSVNLTINAPFAEAEMRTEADAVKVTFQVNLAQLSQELSQFVDLQAWQLRGLGEGKFSLAQRQNSQFEATANLQLTDLHVADAGHEVWTEPKLSVVLTALGIEQDFSPTTLTSANLQLTGPRDQFKANLLEPIQLSGAVPNVQLQVEGNGPLELWVDRLSPWISSVPKQLQGETHLKARVQLAGNRLQVLQSEGSVVQLRLQSDALTLDEPRVEFSGDGAVDLAHGGLQTGELQLLARSFSIRARDVDVSFAGNAPTARGSVAFRADMERVATMANLVGGAQSTWPQGTAVGQIQLTSTGQQVQADLGVKFDKLRIVRTTTDTGAAYGRPEVVWSEPLLEVTGVANYATATDRLQFNNLNVRGETLRLSTNVSVDSVSSVGALQANGLVEYAPEQLAQLVSSYAGSEVQLQGDQQIRFEVGGPLYDSDKTLMHWSQAWDVAAEAGWSSAGVYGLPLSGGKLKGSLRGGQLQIVPLDVIVGGNGTTGDGRLTAAPVVQLLPGAEQLILQPGPLVTDVEISPEVSEQMLKYVAPILAGATRAEGQFSIDLQQAQVPFGQPEQARVQGRLMSHRLDVSPGPMMNQLIAIVKQLESLSKSKQFLQAATRPKTKSFLTMADQQVEFQVVEGRVYHRNLEFLIDGAPVRSYGSVGFDQTLAIVIEVPVQDKWIESEPLLRSLAGQSLKLPIQGTFQKPKIDDRAIADLSRQVLQGAATQAIGGELNRQFEKLFRGK